MCMMQGLVFGVGTDKGVLKLFDVRSYAQGPFDAFTVSHHPLMMLRAVYQDAQCRTFSNSIHNDTRSSKTVECFYLHHAGSV